ETMAPLRNQRAERFAQHLAQGKTADEAYTLAGYRPNRGNAARMKANESILKRVSQLLSSSAVQTAEAEAAAAVQTLITRESLIADHRALAALAQEKGQLAVVASCLKEIGILTGLR